MFNGWTKVSRLEVVNKGFVLLLTCILPITLFFSLTILLIPVCFHFSPGIKLSDKPLLLAFCCSQRPVMLY